MLVLVFRRVAPFRNLQLFEVKIKLVLGEVILSGLFSELGDRSTPNLRMIRH